jgi:uncharacterized Zn finger protein
MTVEQKARRYLTEGRVRVEYQTDESGVYRVSGSKVYTVNFHHSAWACDCPSRTECAHIAAVKLISPLRASRRVTLGDVSGEL